MQPVKRLTSLREATSQTKDELGIGSEVERVVDLMEATDHVPRGFVLTPEAFDRFARENGFDEAMNTELGPEHEGTEGVNRRGTEYIQKKLRSRIDNGSLPSEIVEKLEEHLELLRFDDVRITPQSSEEFEADIPKSFVTQKTLDGSVRKLANEIKTVLRTLVTSRGYVNRYLRTDGRIDDDEELSFVPSGISLVVTESASPRVEGSFEAKYADEDVRNEEPETLLISFSKKGSRPSNTDIYTVDYDTGDITDVHVSEKNGHPMMKGHQADMLIAFAKQIFSPERDHGYTWTEWESTTCFCEYPPELSLPRDGYLNRGTWRPVIRIPVTNGASERRRRSYPEGRCMMKNEAIVEGDSISPGIVEGEVRFLDETDEDFDDVRAGEYGNSILAIRGNGSSIPLDTLPRLVDEVSGIVISGTTSLTSRIAVSCREMAVPALVDCNLERIDEADRVCVDGDLSRVYSAE